MCIRLLFWTKIDPSQQKPTWVNKCSYFVCKRLQPHQPKIKEGKCHTNLSNQYKHKTDSTKKNSPQIHHNMISSYWRKNFTLNYDKKRSTEEVPRSCSDQKRHKQQDIRKCNMWVKICLICLGKFSGKIVCHIYRFLWEIIRRIYLLHCHRRWIIIILIRNEITVSLLVSEYQNHYPSCIN